MITSKSKKPAAKNFAQHAETFADSSTDKHGWARRRMETITADILIFHSSGRESALIPENCFPLERAHVRCYFNQGGSD